MEQKAARQIPPYNGDRIGAKAHAQLPARILAVASVVHHLLELLVQKLLAGVEGLLEEHGKDGKIGGLGGLQPRVDLGEPLKVRLVRLLRFRKGVAVAVVRKYHDRAHGVLAKTPLEGFLDDFHDDGAVVEHKEAGRDAVLAPVALHPSVGLVRGNSLYAQGVLEIRGHVLDRVVHHAHLVHGKREAPPLGVVIEDVVGVGHRAVALAEEAGLLVRGTHGGGNVHVLSHLDEAFSPIVGGERVDQAQEMRHLVDDESPHSDIPHGSVLMRFHRSVVHLYQHVADGRPSKLRNRSERADGGINLVVNDDVNTVL